jgi:cyclomaltodextrinase
VAGGSPRDHTRRTAGHIVSGAPGLGFGVSEADWVRHAIWWQVYPLGFTGAYPLRDSGSPRHPEDRAPEAAQDQQPHRLRRLVAWLDYAVELGVSGLALGPIFASETHGYDTVDHFRIDPRLGDEGDFDALVAAAHDRGLRVLLDGVFNHVGRGHPALPPTGAWSSGRRGEPGDEVRSPETAHWFVKQGDDFANFEGHGGLVALNHREPAVADLVTDVLNHWLDRGADGWRMDAAYAVPPQFWATVLPRVRERHPAAYFVGEVIHGDYADFVARSTLDSVTQYELWKAIWSSLNEGNFYELDHALSRHNEFLDGFVPMTFVGNHDVTRLASRLTDERHVALAVAVLMTVGGTPSVYAGDEQGFTGVKEDREHGDDAVRPPFPAEPADLAPYGQPVLQLHQELIGLRRRHPWLHQARTRAVRLANEQYAYEVTDGTHRIVVCLNVGDEPAEVTAGARLDPHSYRVIE